ncbi:MAG: YciI family protein [Psychrosphaera sp.]|nr:YciI family protein [Psychrosphaera sp.]
MSTTKLGVDEPGMRSFVHVLAKAGKLLVSGPFFEGKPMRGLLIFNVATLEEAQALIKTDPTVEAGIFVYEMTKLYGPAGLM